MRAKISTILRWLLETAATKSRRSSSQKEVTHQIVKEQEIILANSSSRASPEPFLASTPARIAGLRPAFRARGNCCRVQLEGKAREKKPARIPSPFAAGNRRFMGDS
jgi:hypothetical protein